MRILLIDVNCKGSSTGKIVYDLYSYLNNNGDEAAVCYGRGDTAKEPGIFKFGSDFETYLHAALTRITGFTGCFSFFSTRRLLSFIEKFNPDVVHIHELHAYFVNIKPLIEYLKKNHIKTVMTLHCEFIYTGKCGHSVECEKWKTECGNCPHLKDYVRTLWFDRTGYMFRQKKALLSDFEELSIITPSEWLAGRARESFLKNHPISVIHNGIDTSVFYPKDTEGLRRELNIAKDEKVVLALAPHLMSEAKGGNYLLRIAEKLRNEKIKFILVGVDDTSLHASDNVIIMGPEKDRQRIADYYSLADAFVICSQRENFPTTCLEAQACGTPVYGFDTGGTKETAVFPADDNFVPYGDTESLTDLLLKAPVKTKELSKAIGEAAQSEFSGEVFCQKNKAHYVDFYNNK